MVCQGSRGTIFVSRPMATLAVVLETVRNLPDTRYFMILSSSGMQLVPESFVKSPQGPVVSENVSLVVVALMVGTESTGIMDNMENTSRVIDMITMKLISTILTFFIELSVSMTSNQYK